MHEYRVRFINDDGLWDMVEFYNIIDARKFHRELSQDAHGTLYKMVYHTRGVDYIAI